VTRPELDAEVAAEFGEDVEVEDAAEVEVAAPLPFGDPRDPPPHPAAHSARAAAAASASR
jgi:hypothetical protein